MEAPLVDSDGFETPFAFADGEDHYRRELEALLRVSTEVVSSLELEDVLDRILDVLHEVVPYDGASVLAADGYELTVLESRIPRRPDRGALARGVRFSLSGHLATALDERTGLVIPDVHADDPVAASYREVVGARLANELAHVRSWVGVSLTVRHRLIGVLTVQHSEPARFTAEDVRLIRAFAGQAAVAIENARLHSQAQALASLRERQRLARDLHDSVSQALYGIVLGTRTAQAYVASDADRTRDALEYVLSLAEGAQAEMRALIFELRPDALASEGLVVAIEKLVAAAQARHSIAARAQLPPVEPDAPAASKEALYRIAQEALHNVVRHAQAKRVRVRLTGQGGSLHLQVEDDGVGFALERDLPGHLGLHSMRERAEAAGGSVEVDSAPGAGTRVHAVVPAGEPGS